MQNKALAVSQFDWNDEKMKIQVKETFGKDLTNEEWNLFLAIGQFTGLNPFLKEIYAVKYGKDSPASIIIGRDGYRKSAQKHPEYDYHIKASVYENDEFSPPGVNGDVSHKPNLKEPGKLIGAYALVKRKNSTRPNYTFVRFDEYNQSSKNPDGTPKRKKGKDRSGKWYEYDMKPTTWDTKPSTMIEKVAEAQCLRMTFQELFAGTYDESEINENEMNRNQNVSTYDPEEAVLLSVALSECKSANELVRIRAAFIDAYQKGLINSEETERLKVEFAKAKTDFEKNTSETAPAIDQKPEEKIEENKAVEGEVVEKGWNKDVDKDGKVSYSHGIEDPCDDKSCIIHGIS